MIKSILKFFKLSHALFCIYFRIKACHFYEATWPRKYKKYLPSKDWSLLMCFFGRHWHDLECMSSTYFRAQCIYCGHIVERKENK